MLRSAFEKRTEPPERPTWVRSSQAWADFSRYGVRAVNLLDPNFLFASLIWGSIGIGYFIYGKKQQSIVPLIGGVLMITSSYFVGSALMMSVICLGLMAAVYVLLRNGY